MPPGVYVRKNKVDYSVYRGDKPKPRPTPTKKDQQLYNNWRDAERHYELEQKGFLMGPLKLLNPSRNKGWVLPRSRSSSAERLEKSAIGSPSGEDSDDKRNSRGGRTGPLVAKARAKAAFMRALGACDVCRHRHVGCFREHWDLTLFEKAWCELRGYLYREPQPDPKPQPRSEPEPSLLTVDSPMETSPSVTRGIEDNAKPVVTSTLNNIPNALGILDSNSPAQTPFMQFPAPDPKKPPKRRTPIKPKNKDKTKDIIFAQKHNRRLHLDNVLSTMDNIPGPTFATIPPLQSPNTLSPRSYKHVLLGTQPKPERDEWACLWNHEEAASTAASVAGDGGAPCARTSRSLTAHIFHFYDNHHPFDRMDFLLRCKACSFGWAMSTRPLAYCAPCPRCSEVPPHQKELWGSLVEMSPVRNEPPRFIMVTADEGSDVHQQLASPLVPEEIPPGFDSEIMDDSEMSSQQARSDYGSSPSFPPYPAIGLTTPPMSVSSPEDSMFGVEELWRCQVGALESVIEESQIQSQNYFSGYHHQIQGGNSFSMKT
ncbi:hypothetical protein QBC43DRAFT_96124 [Cladorrhinum sp. PSN259]|nr:hypothetical protein QBC43DRAFT_96124 [Cladorrhinum sp. PSN259]